MKNRALLLSRYICLFLIILILGGCWDKKEIEKEAYVIALGMDKGENGNIKITYLIANPEFGTIQQGGSTNEAPHEIISFETGDLVSPKNKGNAVIAKEISYNLLRNIIVSEEMAKEEDFIRWMYETTMEREIRRDLYFIVTKEEASKFISENDPKLETRAQKYFDFILQRGIEIGSIPESSLNKYLRIAEADADLFLGIYATTEDDEYLSSHNYGDDLFAGQLDIQGKTNKTQFIGSALFKEGVMIGKLTAEETRISILLNPDKKAPEIVTSVPDPLNEDFRMAVNINQIKNGDIQMNLTKKGQSKVNVNLPLQLDILTDHNMVNYAKKIDKRNELKRSLEESFEKKINDFIKRTQEEFKAEPFGWSLIARKQFHTIPEYTEFDWMKSYPEMDINVSVTIEFRDFGRQGSLPNFDKVRD